MAAGGAADVAKDRQTSWAAGEITPDLYSRGGILGAKLLRNFLVTPQGTIINRSGSVFIALLGSQTARLESFLFSGDEARLAQLYGPGNVAMRTPDGAFAVAGANDTTGDTVSPSRAVVLDALRKIRVAQCAGTLAIAKSTGLVDLRRVDSTHYNTVAVDYLPPDFGSSATPFSSANNKRNPAVQTAATGITIKAMAGDATHPAREWDYCVTRVVSIASGDPNKANQVIETLPRTVTAVFLGIGSKKAPGRETWTVDKTTGVYTAANVPAEIAVYGDWLQRIDVSGAAGDPWVELATPSRTGTIVAHRVYRGRGGVYGYIGETTTRDFVDDGRDPDIANPPPAGTNPFALVAGSLNPVACAFAGDRRLLANRPDNPQRTWGSAVGNWSDYDEVITPDDADALTFDLAANHHQEVRHILAARALLEFTELKTWAVSGSGDLEVLTPTSIAARPALPVGSAHYPAPIETDDAVFFVEAKGGRPCAMTADGNGAAQLIDLSLYAPHLFEGHTIVSWAWTRAPHKTLWAVRDDGILLSLCFSAGTEVQAWAQHNIAAGNGSFLAYRGSRVEAVAALPVGSEDLLYMVVNRQVSSLASPNSAALFLERLAPRERTDSLLACHLDCASTYDGRKNGLLNISTVNGSDEYVPGADVPPYELTFETEVSGMVAIGDEIIFPDKNGAHVHAIVDTYAGNTGAATVTEFVGETLQIDVRHITDGGHEVAAGLWGVAKSGNMTVSPYIPGTGNTQSHLDGSTMTAGIDGAVHEGLVVGAAGGSVTGKVALPASGLVVVVGLPFKSQMQPLDVEQERGKQKAVSHVRVELGRSRGGAVGSDFEHLTELPPRTVADGYGVIEPRPESHRMTVDSQFSETAPVAIEQSQPKPIKILAVEREYTLGG
jgi:hypothetical protein